VSNGHVGFFIVARLFACGRRLLRFDRMLVGPGASVYYAVLMKWLILFLVLWLVWRVFRSMRRTDPPPARSRGAEVMRACAHCGLNVPESEAIIDSPSASYCCEAHRRLGPAVRRRQ
jgi:uncharacterized protein